MLQLQTTNKKTGEVFTIVAQEEKVTLLNVETKEEKVISESTLKRWYTKPVEVEVEVEVEETVETEQVTVEEVIEAVAEVKEEVKEEVKVETVTEPEKKVKKERKPKKLKIHERPEVIQANSLKEFFLNDMLKQEQYADQLKLNVCKDKTLAYYYKDVCIMRIKGVKKITIAFASKFLTAGTISKMQLLPESYKRTHNAYILLEDEKQITTLAAALNQSIAMVDEIERLANEVETEATK